MCVRQSVKPYNINPNKNKQMESYFVIPIAKKMDRKPSPYVTNPKLKKFKGIPHHMIPTPKPKKGKGSPNLKLPKLYIHLIF